MGSIQVPLAFIGCGNMGSALIRGGIDAGVLEPRMVVAADPDPAKREEIERLGVRSFPDAGGALDWVGKNERAPGDGQVVLAVKPQVLDRAAAELRPAMLCRRVIISILAGTPSAKVRRAISGRAAVVRVMPNTPAAIGRGMSAVCAGDGAGQSDAGVGETLLGAVGDVVRIDEELMDAFTAVVGSGPAYVFYLAEAMVKAAEEVGFDAETAVRIVRQTVAGSGELLATSGDAPAALRDAVTSKGGTTAAATAVLDDERVMDAIARAIVAARDRGRELAQ